MLHIFEFVLVQQEELPTFSATLKQEVRYQILVVPNLPRAINLAEVLDIDRVHFKSCEDVDSDSHGDVVVLCLLQLHSFGHLIEEGAAFNCIITSNYSILPCHGMKGLAAYRSSIRSSRHYFCLPS